MVTRAFDCDVCVVGGGPTGLAAAIASALRGLSVVVVDAGRPPFDKACGEGLMPDALCALGRLGVDLDNVPSAPFEGISFSGYGRRVEAYFSDGPGRGVRRTLLHQVLFKRAQELGVQFRWSRRVTGLDGDFVALDSQLIRARWIVGADGLLSRVRHWSHLDNGSIRSRRVGRRVHYRVASWSKFVEIYWGEEGQAYVTPIGTEEICVAFISRNKHSITAFSLDGYPALKERLQLAPISSTLIGAVTLGRKLDGVATRNVALVGDASGSVDAITGQGLASGFRQAISLADAIANNDLRQYESAHRSAQFVPAFMSQTMLLMDGSWIFRKHAFRAFERCPQLFGQMLSVHVGAVPLRWLGDNGVLRLGWGLITA